MPARCRTLSLPEPQASAKTAAQPYSNCGVHSVVWIFAIREEALGPHHPHTANGLNDLATLLTKCLCGETNGEPEPPGSTFSPQTQPPRGCCLGLAMRKKPVLWPFFALSVGLLTGLTLSVANTWLPRYVVAHHPLVNRVAGKTDPRLLIGTSGGSAEVCAGVMGLRACCASIAMSSKSPVEPQIAVALARVGAAPFAHTWPTFRPDAAFRPALPTGVAAQGRVPPAMARAVISARRHRLAAASPICAE